MRPPNVFLTGAGVPRFQTARRPLANNGNSDLPLRIRRAAAGDVRSGSVKRVASAVGEGAMAVQFVHEYLKEM
jgi:hypothetical protein